MARHIHLARPWVTPTVEQARTIEYLRVRLGERGYVTFGLPEWYRRSDISFIAIHKEKPIQLLAVQPTPKGRVSLTTFRSRTLYPEVKEILRKLRGEPEMAVARFAGSPMATKDLPKNWWEAYLTPEARAELRRLHIFPR